MRLTLVEARVSDEAVRIFDNTRMITRVLEVGKEKEIDINMMRICKRGLWSDEGELVGMSWRVVWGEEGDLWKSGFEINVVPGGGGSESGSEGVGIIEVEGFGLRAMKYQEGEWGERENDRLKQHIGEAIDNHYLWAQVNNLVEYHGL